MQDQGIVDVVSLQVHGTSDVGAEEAHQSLTQRFVDVTLGRPLVGLCKKVNIPFFEFRLECLAVSMTRTLQGLIVGVEVEVKYTLK